MPGFPCDSALFARDTPLQGAKFPSVKAETALEGTQSCVPCTRSSLILHFVFYSFKIRKFLSALNFLHKQKGKAGSAPSRRVLQQRHHECRGGLAPQAPGPVPQWEQVLVSIRTRGSSGELEISRAGNSPWLLRAFCSKVLLLQLKLWMSSFMVADLRLWRSLLTRWSFVPSPKGHGFPYRPAASFPSPKSWFSSSLQSPAAGLLG